MARQRRHRGQRNKDSRASGNGAPAVPAPAVPAKPCPSPAAPGPETEPRPSPAASPGAPALVREVADPKLTEPSDEASAAGPKTGVNTSAVAAQAQAPAAAEGPRRLVVIIPTAQAVQVPQGAVPATGAAAARLRPTPHRPPPPPRGGGRGGRGARGRGGGRRLSEEGDKGEKDTETWLERVRRQVDFYFSDANLRRDKFLQRKIEEGQGFVPLSALLQFNKIRALRCRYPAQLVQAIRKSEMLCLSEDKSRVQRDFSKAPRKDTDPVPRSIYVEGLPLALGIDELTNFFSRHGRVSFIELPRHRDTREPRGFCFVEFSADSEALAAVSALDGVWPSMWGARLDGKVLRAMTKSCWLERREEYRELLRERAGRRPLASTVSPDDERRGAPKDADADPESVPASSSRAPAPKASEGNTRKSSRAREQPGCLLRMSGFTQLQTILSLRQFAEHAVPVEYCDLPQKEPLVAVLRLRCPEDCQALVEDARQSRRLLGWELPDLHVLRPEEELAYWRAVDERRAAQQASAPSTQSADSTAGAGASLERGGAEREEAAETAEAEMGKQEHRRRRRRGPDCGTTSIRRWPLRAGSRGGAPHRGASQPSGCFVDTVCGNARFTEAGLGRSRRGRRRGPPPSAKGSASAVSLKRPATGPAAGEPPVKLPALNPVLLPVPVFVPAPVAPVPAALSGPAAPTAAAASVGPQPALDLPAGGTTPPPASPPPPSGAKPKRKPQSRVPASGPPRTPVPRPPPSAVAEALIPPPSPVPISSPGRGERRRLGEKAPVDPRLPPPSPVARPPEGGRQAASSSAAPMPVGLPPDSNAGQGKDSMLADTDDILGLMDD